MSGKGAKGLIMGKASASNKEKDKKKPISRSSRAGLQVFLFRSLCFLLSVFILLLFSAFSFQPFALGFLSFVEFLILLSFCGFSFH